MRAVGSTCLLVAALWAIPATASATVYNIHVGGVCGTSYTGASLGSWSGEVSINAPVDQRSSMARAVSDLRATLDRHCLGNDSCWVFTYSSGSAVISKVLSIYDTPWNIDWVVSSGGSEGGSEIAATGWIGRLFGQCLLATNGELTPSSLRNGWNHNDTGGNGVIAIGGRGTIWYTFGATHLILPGTDDSVVAFHSAGGMSDAGYYWDLCAGPKYSNHYIYYGHCRGEREHHLSIAGRFVCMLGGC